MNTWFTADHHFGHARIIEFCERPFSDVEEMDEAMIAGWNSRVKPGDIIYHMGDFSFHRKKEAVDNIVDRLNGQIHLIYGNHDRKGVMQCDKFAWKGVLKYIKIDDQKIMLCHYAMRVWRASHHGSWMLYGHSHGTLSEWGKSLDVGVDDWDYMPISFQEIKMVMDGRRPELVDHHGRGDPDED